MKKTFQTILSTSLLLVCTFYVQQLSAQKLIATINNETDFTAHVNVYYTTAPNRPVSFDVPAKTKKTAPDGRLLLIKSVSATYDANGSKSVTQVRNFVAVASTAYAEFVIKEEALGSAGEFACAIYRVDESGNLINRIRPGFVFKNNTKYYIMVTVGRHGNSYFDTKQVIAPGESWTQDFDSKKYNIQFNISTADGLIWVLGNISEVILEDQYSGDPQLWTTATTKPTYAISGGHPANLVVTKTN